MKNSRVSVRFSAELRKRLKTIPARTKTRESDLIRKAVERQLTAEENAPTANRERLETIRPSWRSSLVTRSANLGA